MIKLKRAYEAPSTDDGPRILIERLWPRGLTKKDAGIDLWMKNIAPSAALRKWFAHDPAKWAEFKRKYRAELRHNKDAVSELKKKTTEAGLVTLVYAARDQEHNGAVVLKSFLESKSGK